MKIPRPSEQFLPQLNLVDGRVVDLTISDKTSYAGGQFSIKQFDGFKAAVNEFDYNSKKHCCVDAKNTGLRVCIYRDAENIELSMSDCCVATSVTFSVEEWEKFKKQVNDFDVEVIQKRRSEILAAAERTNVLSLIPKWQEHVPKDKQIPPIAKEELFRQAENKFEISKDRVLAVLRVCLREGTIYEPASDCYRIT